MLRSIAPDAQALRCASSFEIAVAATGHRSGRTSTSRQHIWMLLYKYDRTAILRMSASDKRLIWWASSRKDLQRMPPEVQRTMGYALRIAQEGSHVDHATRMSGHLRDVFEVSDDDDAGKSTFRVFYTTAIGNVVHVLDAIQKKSKKRIALACSGSQGTVRRWHSATTT